MKIQTTLRPSLIFPLILLIGCGGKSETQTTNTSPQGSGVMTYTATSNNFDIQLNQQVDTVLMDVIQSMNNRIALPQNLPVTRKDCQAKDAYYNFVNKDITLCNELLDDIRQYGISSGIATQDSSHTYAAAVFGYLIFSHELGHALINLYELPVLGKQEDAADAFSVVLLMEEAGKTQAQREEIAKFQIEAAMYMYYLTQGTKFTDVHSMNNVRLANLTCWAAGAQPSILQKDQTILNFASNLFNNQIRNCVGEYQQQKESVYKLLAAYLK